MKLIISIFLLVFSLGTLTGEELIEKLTKHLCGRNLSIEKLEREYSCIPIETVIISATKDVSTLEETIKNARENTRLAGLLPTFTVWGKYRENEKLYLYQQNNISVGKDYITVGPDEHNSTHGDLNTLEVGARMQFKLSRLLYNSDTIRYTRQEENIMKYKQELIEKISYAYYFITVVKAIESLRIDVPADLMIPAGIHAKTYAQWIYSLIKTDLFSCRKKEQVQ